MGKEKEDNDDRKKEFCPEKYGSAPLEILKTTPHFCAALSSYGGRSQWRELCIFLS